MKRRTLRNLVALNRRHREASLVANTSACRALTLDAVARTTTLRRTFLTELRRRWAAEVALGKSRLTNSNPEGCNQYKSCEGGEKVHSLVTEASHDSAEVMLSQGIRPDFKRERVVEEFAPGAGLDRGGAYVAREGASSRGSFGMVRLHLDVPESSLDVPQEMKQLGYAKGKEVAGQQSLDYVLGTENGGVTTGEVPKSAFKKVEVYENGKWESMTPKEYLEKREVSEVPRLPGMKEYENTLRKRQDELGLQERHIQKNLTDYNRANLSDKHFLAQDLGLVGNVRNCQPGQLRDAGSGRCGPGLGIDLPRDSMPQVKPADLPTFVAFAIGRGVSVTPVRIRANDLSPTQREFRQERVDDIPDEALSSPLLVSSDDYILDGTHRWVKAWQSSPDTLVSVLRIGLPLREALSLMRAFPDAIYTANWDESQHPRDASGKFGEEETVHITPEEAFEGKSKHQVAQALFKAVDVAEGGDYQDACSATNYALHEIYPRAERWKGTYEGEDHEWAKVGDHFIDVTAKQFGGPDTVVSSKLPPEYKGRQAEWDKNSEHKRTAKIIEAAMKAARVVANLYLHYPNRSVQNFNPDQPRDDHGRFGSGGSSPSTSSPGEPSGAEDKGPAGKTGVVAKLVKAGSMVAHAEHVASTFVKDKIGAGIDKLPYRTQEVVEGAFAFLRGGFKAAFSNFTVMQALAERISKEKGSTPEQARRLRGVLSTIDNKTFEVLKVGAVLGHVPGLHALHVLHAPAVLSASLPVATTSYVAYNTARHLPSALRAADGLIADTVDRLTVEKARDPREAKKLGVERLGRNVATEAVENADDEGIDLETGDSGGDEKSIEGVANALADALEAHDYDDWYIALLSCALDQGGEVADQRGLGHVENAIEIADAVYTHRSEDTSEPADDDEDALLKILKGKDEATDEDSPAAMNSFCPTGAGGGVDPSCAPGKSAGVEVPKRIKGSGTKDSPYKVGSDIKLAAKLLAAGHHVKLAQPEQVATLLDRLEKVAKKAEARGEAAPKIDLCKVSAPKSNLFCQDSLGIPRIEMPQMRGLPVPGTYAAEKAERGEAGKKSGKVDLSAEFIQHMQASGIKTERTDIRASHLRASQSEIVGARVGQLIRETREGNRNLREKPIFVTKDNYIVDGHHHWAAIVGKGYSRDKDLKVPVYKLDTDIGTALRMANEYTKKAGLAPKSGTTTNEGGYVINPFVSEEQRKKCYAANDPAWDCDEWQTATPKDNLPERSPTANTSPCLDPALWEKYLGRAYLAGAATGFDDARAVQRTLAHGDPDAEAYHAGSRDEFLGRSGIGGLASTLEISTYLPEAEAIPTFAALANVASNALVRAYEAGRVGATARLEGRSVANAYAVEPLELFSVEFSSAAVNNSLPSPPASDPLTVFSEALNYNPDQPRGPDGRFTSGSGGSGDAAEYTPGAIAREPTTAPPPGKVYAPDVTADHNKDGVTDAARIGVPAMSVPPPPKIGRLPNLTLAERVVEHAFITHYESDPDKVAGDFKKIVLASTKPGEAPTFGTDDAKVLTDAWSHPDPAVRSVNRATLNCALHQTANAVAKRAFLQHLDTLKPGDEILTTVGGCGAGKGYCLGKDKETGKPFVPVAFEMKQRAKAVWDSAGDQNATESPWIQAEAEKRGLKVNYAFVHADPYTQWSHPERGVVKRAGDPNDGRMVDAKVFADSYALGAKNHAAFAEQHKDNPNASFIFLTAGKNGPERIPGVPEAALKLDAKHLADFAIKTVKEGDAPPHVKRGGTIGERIWRDVNKVE